MIVLLKDGYTLVMKELGWVFVLFNPRLFFSYLVSTKYVTLQ